MAIGNLVTALWLSVYLGHPHRWSWVVADQLTGTNSLPD